MTSQVITTDTRPWKERIEDDSYKYHAAAASNWQSCAVGEKLQFPTHIPSGDIDAWLLENHPVLADIGEDFYFDMVDCFASHEEKQRALRDTLRKIKEYPDVAEELDEYYGQQMADLEDYEPY